VWNLARDLCRLLHSWWQRDRIGVSPREGRLLRLAPTCFLLIGGEPAHVVRRAVRLLPYGGQVRYQCVTCSGSARLDVWLTEDGTPYLVRWQENGQVRELAEDEI
jgi:hypothetical protein